ncbi:MAG: hypothetical protein A2V88_14830 [Elusimicrobia bacterium RBG_16_66_12]|nr:MAG: hypothetical protein A2V88_14830 [Elusimicrobia bacterium RBG_16_66_12]
MDPMPPWEDLVIREAPAPVAAASTPKPSAHSAAKSRRTASGRQVQAAYLTHELRAPVTSIRLGLEILAEQVQGRLEADEKHMLSLAIRNTQRLEGLVNDIMDYSKIAAGKMAIVKEACDARALVDDAVDTMKAAATTKSIKLVKTVDPLLPRCAAESRRVIQVMINLLSNAIKYTPARGAVSVSVSEGRYEHAGTLLFKVKDSGCGIAPEDLEKIFGMFEQAGHAGARKAEGTGLGLTLARAMVELHGGRIWAESWKGCGAAFCFTIPIAPIDLARPASVYAQPLEIHGLLAEFARRFNAVLALFV